MRFPSYDRWLSLGVAFFPIGATIDVTWYVYTYGTKTSFWTWIGIFGTFCAVAGLVMLMLGFFLRSDEKVNTSDPVAEEGQDRKIRQERIGYRLSGNAKSRSHNAHISHMDVAFDVRDNAEQTDTDTRIE